MNCHKANADVQECTAELEKVFSEENTKAVKDAFDQARDLGLTVTWSQAVEMYRLVAEGALWISEQDVNGNAKPNADILAVLRRKFRELGAAEGGQGDGGQGDGQSKEDFKKELDVLLSEKLKPFKVVPVVGVVLGGICTYTLYFGNLDIAVTDSIASRGIIAMTIDDVDILGNGQHRMIWIIGAVVPFFRL